MFWCKFSAMFETELTKKPSKSGNKIEVISGCPEGNQSDSEKRRRVLGTLLLQCTVGLASRVSCQIKLECEILHHFSVFAVSVAIRGKCAVLLCVWGNCSGSSRARNGVSKNKLCFHGLLLDAHMGASVKIKVLVPREQLWFLHENHCVKCTWMSTSSIVARKKAGIYLLSNIAV